MKIFNNYVQSKKKMSWLCYDMCNQVLLALLAIVNENVNVNVNVNAYRYRFMSFFFELAH
jgi:hypothetical protein